MYSSFREDIIKKSNFEDTTLRLDGFGYGTRESSAFTDSQTNGFLQKTRADNPDDGCKLVLGLGPTSSAYPDEYSPFTGNKTKGPTPVSSQGPSSQQDSILKLGLSGGADAISNSLECSHFDTCHPLEQVSPDSNGFVIPVADEGSTSAKRSGGYMRHLIMAPRMESNEILLATNNFSVYGAKSCSQLSQPGPEPAVSNYSMSVLSGSGNTTRNTKRCKFDGCTKGARGTTNMCIGHGGGSRCQKLGCNKGAESRTAYCKTHGGGKRCQHLGCTKCAERKTDHCIAHGGGKRCGYLDGCAKAARGRSGLCIGHGGGKRCKVDECTRSAEGQIGLCISHGGGRRCRSLECTKGAQGSTDFCKAHGGGKRCVFAGCMRGAEGSTPLCKGHGGGKRCLFDGGGICPKSVHGGTNFCVGHGGGKRCSVSRCTKSARGRTDCCVKHGGGKRCRFKNCEKSAQGSTDLCKAHGGGKRCSWGERKCEKYARGKSGLCAAHSSMVKGREANRVGTIGPGLFRGLVPPDESTIKSSFEKTCSSSGVIVVSEFDRSFKWQQLIPPQLLVPLSMKDSIPCLEPLDSEKDQETSDGFDVGGDGAGKSFGFVAPEGRVHGGGLLSFLGGNINNAINGI